MDGRKTLTYDSGAQEEDTRVEDRKSRFPFRGEQFVFVHVQPEKAGETVAEPRAEEGGL